MDVLKHIEELRLERGWSTYKLAEMSGLTGSTLTNMFSRKTMPSLTTLYALCEAFDITMSEFFSNDGDRRTYYRRVKYVKEFSRA